MGNTAVKAVVNNFSSLIDVDTPSTDDELVEAVLVCFREAVVSVDASRFVPDLVGGALPNVGALAPYRGASGDPVTPSLGPESAVSAGAGAAGHVGDGVGAEPVGSGPADGVVGGMGAGSAGHGGGVVPAEAGAARGPASTEARSGASYIQNWRVLDTHNVMGTSGVAKSSRITHPAQLLAYSFGAVDFKKTMKELRSGDGILSAFAPSHVNDLHKALKPAARAKKQMSMWYV